MSAFHVDGKTCVFWDVEDYPIPDGLDPASIYQRIKEAIWKRGIHGEVSIQAYADKDAFSDELEGKFSEAGLKLEVFTEGGKQARNYSMYADIELWAFINPIPSNMILLAEFMEDDLAENISYLCLEGYGVLLSDAKPEWYSNREYRFPDGSTATFLTSMFPEGSLERKLRSLRSRRSRGARLTRLRKREAVTKHLAAMELTEM